MDKSHIGGVLVLAGLAVGTFLYMERSTVGLRTRENLLGLWHLEGSSMDWRFAKDGSFVEDGLFDTTGTFLVLDDGRVRITAWAGSATFEPVFSDGEVLLRGIDGTMRNARLTRKD